jgi:hypothetical protein
MYVLGLLCLESMKSSEIYRCEFSVRQRKIYVEQWEEVYAHFRCPSTLICVKGKKYINYHIQGNQKADCNKNMSEMSIDNENKQYENGLKLSELFPYG